MIWTKWNHQSAKFQAFDCSREILPNLYFDRPLLLKVYKISAKKVWRSYVYDAKFEEKLICFKNDNNLVNFYLSTQNSQILHFDRLLLLKVYKISAKKIWRSYVSWHWIVMQNDKNLVNFDLNTRNKLYACAKYMT